MTKLPLNVQSKVLERSELTKYILLDGALSRLQTMNVQNNKPGFNEQPRSTSLFPNQGIIYSLCNGLDCF